jgi:outer membrane protein TolC
VESLAAQTDAQRYALEATYITLASNVVGAAIQEVADTLHASLSDADALATNVRAETAAKVTYDLTRRQMEVGYVNYLILLNAETTYQQALILRVQAQATRFGDTIALFQALGGGWWNRKGEPNPG